MRWRTVTARVLQGSLAAKMRILSLGESVSIQSNTCLVERDQLVRILKPPDAKKTLHSRRNFSHYVSISRFIFLPSDTSPEFECYAIIANYPARILHRHCILSFTSQLCIRPLFHSNVYLRNTVFSFPYTQKIQPGHGSL